MWGCMRIKQLELVGFKSFVERTVLTFSDGTTAIVGPNGCGKSNVVDAIRWALGEQSPKHLRGAAMEDVIFKGNDRRAPLGMAEVSLTFENDAAGWPADGDPELDLSVVPSHVRGLPEITVTRRYYRSGESEYLINRAACRLKDITELFLGTGIGTKAYAIIEQGRVEQLISAKPEERRLFIEEAAGTTLYRSRKLAAERKMERTRENLLRVNDILHEVERQIQYLNRQARKAEQYRSVQAEIRSLELAVAGAQWRTMTGDVTELEADVARRRAEEARWLGELQQAEALRAETHRRVSAADQRLSAEREDAARETAELETYRQRVALLGNEIAERRERATRLAGERLLLDGQAEALARDAAAVDRERQDYADQLSVEERHTREQGAAVEACRAVTIAADGRAEAAKDQLVGVLAREAEARNQAAALQRRDEEISRRLTRLRDEEQQVAAELLGLDEELVARRATLDAVRQRLRDLAGEREGHSGRLRQLAEEKRRAEQEASRMQAHLLQVRSRLGSLLEIQRNFEGYQRGVRSIMVAPHSAGGVLGVVADVIAAPREYERAVAAVLGDRLQYMIVGEEEQAVGAVGLLRSEESGRGSFIPRSPRRISINGDGAASANGHSMRLLDLMRVEEGYRDVAEMLLGDVVVVPDLMTALSLWRRNGVHVTMVTPDGDVLDAHGVITGGSERPVEEEILSRRREIDELEIGVAAAAEHVDRALAEMSRLTAAQAAEDAALRDLDAGVHDLTLKAIAAEKDCERSEADSPRCLERIEVIRGELESAASEGAEARRELETLRAGLADLDRVRVQMEAELNAAQRECARLKAELDSVIEGLAAARVRVAECRERHHALSSRATEMTRQAGDLRQRMEQLETEHHDTLSRCEALAREAQESAAVVVAAEAHARERAAAIAQAAARAEEVREAAAQQDAGIEQIRAAIDTGRAERVTQETSLAEKRVRLEHLEQTMREKHGVELPVAASGGNLGEPDEHAVAQLEQLRERLARIGEVNVGAIEELQELEGRAQFLRSQRDDLERSLADLERTIAKLNRASRARFQETFQAVNEKFRTVFPRLFRGGEAHLVLTDEHNVLESGVEIFVRPPGKRLDTVTLLSGGEKALVAVSLIFSLFLICPTPFCFLDEVDAPLDDANVGRFVHMVREMGERSQFIMITHNKRTMEAADCLYGVTMEEAGVSKVISVAMR